MRKQYNAKPNNLFRGYFVILNEELRQSIVGKNIIFIAAFTLLLWLTIYLGNNLQAFLVLFFRTLTKFPYTFLLPFFAAYLAIPLLCIFVSYNSVSKEFSSNIHYLASKVSRNSIILGKYTSNLIQVSTTVLVVFLLSAIYTYWNLGQIIILPTIKLWFFLTIYSAVFIALVTFMSSITNTSHSSLHNSLLLAFLLFLVSFNLENIPSILLYLIYVIVFYIIYKLIKMSLRAFGKQNYWYDILCALASATAIFLSIKYIKYISPFYYYKSFIDFSVSSLLALIGFTVLIILFTLYIFNRRDLY